jgi:hypothetical protein
VVSLEEGDFKAMSTDQVRALTTGQVQALSIDDITALTTTQVASLTTAQIRALTTDQVQALEPGDVKALTSGQIVAFTTTQVFALTNAQITGLTTVQIATLSTAQIRALETADFAALSTNQLKALTTDQLCALSTTQIAALSTAQLAVLPANYTPLVLDLDGDDVETRSLAEGTRFDLDADGQLDRTGWASPDDGLLVRDLNGDGQVNDGTELFGAATRLPDGSVARDGFQALASLDSNADGVVNATDPAFAELRVWQDRDSNGLASADELKTLEDLSINSLGVRPSVELRADQGNMVGLVSTYDSADGSRELADVWFLAPGVQTDPAAALTDALERYDSGIESSSGGRSQAEASAGALYSDEKVEGIMAALSSFSQSGGAVDRIAGTLPGSSNPLSTAGDDERARRPDSSDPLLLGKS